MAATGARGGLYSWLGFPADRIIEFATVNATVNAAATLGLAGTTGQLAPATTVRARLVINRTGRVRILAE